MAINVLGEEVEDSPAVPSPGSQKCSEPIYSPYDDLAFVMYVDNEIADLVRILDNKKKDAVAGNLDLLIKMYECLNSVNV